ncbi:MAG: DUF4139 domain-containing protein [Deltaproteobacteria bacterium]|nr:DUF4139 domain-containing protein [Deltaproteobacteria bacterium]
MVEPPRRTRMQATHNSNAGNVAGGVSVVERVKLHPDGARVLRRGQAKAGWVCVENFPLSILSDGLQLQPDHGSILAREDSCAVLQIPPAYSERPTTLKAELRAQQEEALHLTKWRKQLESQEVRVPVTREENVEVPGFAHWQVFDEQVLSERVSLRKKLCAIRDDVETLRRDIESTSRGIVGPTQAPTITRGIRFLLEGDGEINFAIEYSIRGARWVPSYRLDLKSDDDKSAVLRVMGLCANASGEDWSEAKIRLLTAAMKREVALPELTSWRLGRKQQPQSEIGLGDWC